MKHWFTPEHPIEQYIPNVIQPVHGEKPLQDKIYYYLEAAAQWFTNNFYPATADTDTETGRTVIALEAIIRALPALDVTVTPNGIATVGTNTLVPASSQRVQSLANSLQHEKNRCIDTLMRKLLEDPKWRKTIQGSYVTQSLFQEIRQIPKPSPAECHWEAYRTFRNESNAAEYFITEKYISHDISAILRSTVQDNKSPLARQARNTILAYYRAEYTWEQQARQLVETIRHSSLSTIWQQTHTAYNFGGERYQNQRKSTGYFF